MISAGGDFNGMVRSNSTAAAIIDMLATDISREQMIAAMLERYDATEEEISADVDKVLSTLDKIGALE